MITNSDINNILTNLIAARDAIINGKINENIIADNLQQSILLINILATQLGYDIKDYMQYEYER